MKTSQIGLFFASTLLALFHLGHAESSMSHGDEIIALNDSNYDLLRNSQDAEWLILFYADWCGACSAFKPAFHRLAQWVKENAASVRVAAVNDASSPQLMTRFLITRLPTIFHVKHGEYREIPFPSPDLPTLIQQETWRKITPISPWRTPFSLLGRTLGCLGLIGHTLTEWMRRAESLTGLDPVWVLALFAIGLVSLFVLIIFVEGFILHKKRVPERLKKD